MINSKTRGSILLSLFLSKVVDVKAIGIKTISSLTTSLTKSLESFDTPVENQNQSVNLHTRRTLTQMPAKTKFRGSNPTSIFLKTKFSAWQKIYVGLLFGCLFFDSLVATGRLLLIISAIFSIIENLWNVFRICPRNCVSRNLAKKFCFSWNDFYIFD